MGYNESLYILIMNEGFIKALTRVGKELENILTEKYGDLKVSIVCTEKETVQETQLIAMIDQLTVEEHNHAEEVYIAPTILLREPSSSDPQAPESIHAYFQHLGDYRFNSNDWDENNLVSYGFDESILNPSGLSRINKEIKALTRSLPCEPSGAVFINMDSSNMSKLKAIISGSADSPYEHGLFLFAIKLPSDYPNSPPLMTIKTTGNRMHRFNPNLYDTGFVCLSIINTWEGDQEEMWNPTYSTLLQVFLSIQALVMNQSVIQKEPSYEGYAEDSQESKEYIMIVRYGNIKYAMSDMIRNPPVEFKDVVLRHFAIKKNDILETTKKWVQEAKEFNFIGTEYLISYHNPCATSQFQSIGIGNAFEEAEKELIELLNGLPTI